MKSNSPLAMPADATPPTANLLIKWMALFWLIAKCMSCKLWLSNRLFPLLPVADFIQYPSFIHAGLFLFSLALLLLLLFNLQHKYIFTALLITELLTCIADQTRWQPWEYQYLFSILVVCLNYNQPRKIITSLAFIMIATYCYSGIGKLNTGYLQVWNYTFLKKAFHLTEQVRLQPLVYYSGYLTALLEAIMGIALLFKITKKIAAWVLIAMHVGILLVLGPAGAAYNSIIWPWNMAMIIFLYLLFIKNNFSTHQFWDLRQGWNKLTLVAWGFLPALNYAGYWDDYLSCRLYSRYPLQMAFCLQDTATEVLMEDFSTTADPYSLCDGKALVNLQIWAMKELNVPQYPARRTYQKMEEKWKAAHPLDKIIYFRPHYPKGIEKATLTP